MTPHSRRSQDAVNKVFGEDLSDMSVDDRDDPSPDDDADRERWLRDNVPPHHD